jgi:hypothetical protein
MDYLKCLTTKIPGDTNDRVETRNTLPCQGL